MKLRFMAFNNHHGGRIDCRVKDNDNAEEVTVGSHVSFCERQQIVLNDYRLEQEQVKGNTE